MVEFIGLSRILTGKKTEVLNLHEGASDQDILKMLGKKYPELIGEIIDPNFKCFQGSNQFCLNGRTMLPEESMDESPKDGDQLTIMALLAGG